ncbi:MAG: beta-L-arabinofuranosidase domain-containing protein [Pyrinomonadaceae bacterium]
MTYTFSGVPFISREKFEGHSVRAMYAASGAADYFAETRSAAHLQTLETLWRDLVTQKMYLTGGVGSRENGEAIGEPYELPNEQAYTETCAAIGSYMWNWRMLAITGEARFASIGERALYNGVLSGVSLSGDHYFYRNPLSALGRTERKPWYDTTCCPPNIQRTLASLPGYFYSTSAAGLWTHLYHNLSLIGNWRMGVRFASHKLRIIPGRTLSSSPFHPPKWRASVFSFASRNGLSALASALMVKASGKSLNPVVTSS